jgi:ABC-type phosphate transport system substrate-binding protein
MRKLLPFFLLLSATQGMAEDRVPIGSQAIVVAANLNAEMLKLTPQKLKLIYLRKQLYWPNGKPIQPVNLYTEHPLRKQFSQTVLGSLPAEQVKYWNEQYFNGIRPPHVVNSEEAALRYVAQTEYAIAYVDACRVDERVQAVLWLHHNEISVSAPEELNCAKNP